MALKILAVGKKHEAWVSDGITRYEERLKKPFDLTWQLIPHSARENDAARREESERLIGKLGSNDFVILLDERGKALDSPGLARTLQPPIDGARPVILIIGGAYGVDPSVHTRANLVWSLSPLVFPHQLVRLILAEQLYRAQEIASGRPYHHE